MNDDAVLQSINELMGEEHTLLKAAEAGGLTDQQRQRLHAVKVQLDQCWDLLRQRRAKREFGQDPDAAQPRDESTVEGYKA
ncbi:MAG TPA: DUF2630 family protein [Ktedonobacterales bacterium]